MTIPDALIEAFVQGYEAGVLYDGSLTLLAIRERARQEAEARVTSGVLRVSEEGT